ncbi:sce7726 family protein [Curtobacterium sp. MCBD17_035]|uniref:sce7726 family protein n=1 Tax=Curtobacterium sp. MCBD17_035 TaxID=2175673 RepID=UPI0011B35EF8|nr:sce7726 family protein [Curtobacterium sp. MCBD17_035]WIB68098.1 sce7726 family protein [Curtobacterium sp. MCBD17_035]
MTTLATSMATSDQSPGSTDADLRAALLSQLARGRRQQYIVEEMGIAGEARVDVALIGDHLHGFEIKSERDSLRRLPSQVEVFSRVFDYVTLVVDTRHLDGARRIIPDWWGVTEACTIRSGMRLVRRSQARRNRTLDPWYLTSLLWRDEALEVLASLGSDRGMRSKNGTQLRRALVEQVSTNALRDAVRSRLQLRPDWRPAAQ